MGGEDEVGVGDCGIDSPSAERGTTAALVAEEADGMAVSGDCQCSVVGESCSCSDACEETNQLIICRELLGRCQCIQSINAVCECYGHCPSAHERKRACEREPGCVWTGMVCQAMRGMLWS
eukprot:NODE_3622_length_763_cov_176.720339.p2 GENE.NODE_3622_length_763_cov_176.720339~~NODE_3622_length_763_cov_176.720339.p2  ORF type:complete len:121 (+),score=24.23 NODE_3622_length_763_cov_176.720339:3-365(+)